MRTLAQMLEHRTWRELWAISHMYGLPFRGRMKRADYARHLHTTLRTCDLVRQEVRQLDASAREALVALRMAGGVMPACVFMSAFGKIRPFRPWREDAPRQPWKQPISAAERLWYLGLVEIDRDVVYGAEEALRCVPLPRVKPIHHAVETDDEMPINPLLTDLAIWLGMVSALRPRTTWGRWLPLSALWAIQRRLWADDPSGRDGRSELQTGRLKFLHYLAEVTGLVSNGDTLYPTVAAWAWLEERPQAQWEAIWRAVRDDLRSADPVWGRYRLPAISSTVWTALWSEIGALAVGSSYSLITLIGRLRAMLLGESLIALPDVLEGLLSWAGVVKIEGDVITRLPMIAAEERSDCQLIADVDVLIVKMSSSPRSRPLMEAQAWTERGEGRDLIVTEKTITATVGQGIDPMQIVETLAAMIGQPVSGEIVERIVQWAKPVRAVEIRQMTVLTADGREIERIMGDRRLRAMIERPLSRNQIAVQPTQIKALVQGLRRRGWQVNCAEIDETRARRDEMSATQTEYLWLAGRVYQGLRAWLPSMPPMSGAVLDEAKARTSDPDALASAAEGVIAALRRMMLGDPMQVPESPIALDDPAAICVAVQRAFDQCERLTIDYFSPTLGMITRRTISPILPIVRRGNTAYVEAWCEHDAAARTFRLDRILRIEAEAAG